MFKCTNFECKCTRPYTYGSLFYQKQKLDEVTVLAAIYEMSRAHLNVDAAEGIEVCPETVGKLFLVFRKCLSKAVDSQNDFKLGEYMQL